MTADPGQATRPLWKRVADAKARAAMKGITLHELTGDDGQPEFIVTQHAMAKAFAGAGAVAAAEAWLDRIEGKQP